jgi:hypothetical protein
MSGFLRLFLLNLVVLTAFLVCAHSVSAQGQDWKPSDRKDDIETYYQVDKIASDKFAVKIRVNNYRPFAVKVIVQVKYERLKPSYRLPLLFNSQIGTYRDQCTVVARSASNSVCTVTVTAKKVTGVKIVRWDNAY